MWNTMQPPWGDVHKERETSLILNLSPSQRRWANPQHTSATNRQQGKCQYTNDEWLACLFHHGGSTSHILVQSQISKVPDYCSKLNIITLIFFILSRFSSCSVHNLNSFRLNTAMYWFPTMSYTTGDESFPLLLQLLICFWLNNCNIKKKLL
jgi:hypothetical protein